MSSAFTFGFEEPGSPGIGGIGEGKRCPAPAEAAPIEAASDAIKCGGNPGGSPGIPADK